MLGASEFELTTTGGGGNGGDLFEFELLLLLLLFVTGPPRLDESLPFELGASKPMSTSLTVDEFGAGVVDETAAAGGDVGAAGLTLAALFTGRFDTVTIGRRTIDGGLTGTVLSVDSASMVGSSTLGCSGAIGPKRVGKFKPTLKYL